MFQLFFRAQNYVKKSLGGDGFWAHSAERDADTDRARIGSIVTAIENALHAAESKHFGLSRKLAGRQNSARRAFPCTRARTRWLRWMASLRAVIEQLHPKQWHADKIGLWPLKHADLAVPKSRRAKPTLLNYPPE
jgi:hypothetical protein